MKDHRGNNLGSLSDGRTQHDDNNDGMVDYYTANAVTFQDYSSFGALLEGRQCGIASRHTYNGKEQDKETGWQDYGMREYLGGEVPVFASVDPITKKYPELTPYQFASNSPIWGIDLDGEEFLSNFNSRQNTYFAGQRDVQLKPKETVRSYDPSQKTMTQKWRDSKNLIANITYSIVSIC